MLIEAEEFAQGAKAFFDELFAFVHEIVLEPRAREVMYCVCVFGGDNFAVFVFGAKIIARV